jgi:spermidine/putrescine-binding protein
MKGKFIELALNLGTKDEAFRKLLAALETDEGGVDIITPSDPNTTTRVNKAPGEPTK